MITFRQISKRLGYKRVSYLYRSIGYTASNISRIKRDNKERYKMLMYLAIINHYGITHAGLIDMMEAMRDGK